MCISDYRRIARENLSGNWKSAIGTAIVASLLGGLLTGASFLFSIRINLDEQGIRTIKEIFPHILEIATVTGAISSVLGIVSFILGGVIQLGYAKYLLKQHDHREPKFNDLFSMFDQFGAGFCQALLRGLYIFLWSLLFVIPGIVASYRYAMTPFIMAENPELSASEAITLSKHMMNGRKWELFCLDFSFIGWSILCGLTLNLGYIFLNPYCNAAHAAFYRNLTQQTPGDIL